jgi:hypothetical protein
LSTEITTPTISVGWKGGTTDGKLQDAEAARGDLRLKLVHVAGDATVRLIGHEAGVELVALRRPAHLVTIEVIRDGDRVRLAQDVRPESGPMKHGRRGSELGQLGDLVDIGMASVTSGGSVTSTGRKGSGGSG